MRGCRDPDYSSVSGDYPDGWQSYSNALAGYYAQYRTLAAHVKAVWRVHSQQPISTSPGASTQVLCGFFWGNENSLAMASPTTEIGCRQAKQNSPRCNNLGLKWNWIQRVTGAVSGSPDPSRRFMSKFFDLRKADRSHAPYGNFRGSSAVPLTTGRVGNVPLGHTAWCLDTPPGSAYPTDEMYLRVFAASQDVGNTSGVDATYALPLVHCDIEIDYYVMFYDVAYQDLGDP